MRKIAAWRMRAMTVTVRATADPLGLVPDIRRLVQSMDPELALTDVELMSSVIGRSLSRMSFTATVLAPGAAVAFVLGAIGIYAVIAFVMSRTERSVCAGRWAPIAKVSSDLSREKRSEWRAPASSSGLRRTVGLGGTISSLLYGVSAHDPATLVAALRRFCWWRRSRARCRRPRPHGSSRRRRYGQNETSRALRCQLDERRRGRSKWGRCRSEQVVDDG